MTTNSSLLEAAQRLGPRIRSASDAIESERRLPEDLFCALAEIGVFKAFLPARFGGSGASLSELAPVIEEIARADGSAGWLAYVGSEAMRQTLLLPEPVAAHIVASPHAFIAGMFTPGQSRAVAVPGGYRVTGHWHTCSGSLHADWLLGGASVFDGDHARQKQDGAPVVRLNFMPMSAAKVIDTWHVGGLKGTNSNDIEVEDVFVPEEYGAYDVPPPDIGLHLMVPLGIARAAMQEFASLASKRGPSKAGGVLYRDMPAVAREVAAAEGALRAARHYAYAELQAADAGRTDVDSFLLAAHHVAHTALGVVDTLHRAAGASGIFQSSHLLRCFLDVHVAAAHVSLQPFNLETAGRRFME